MVKVILIAVSDGFGGYGDFLFALKLAAQIKETCANLLFDENPLEIKLITQASGKQKIESLKGDTEFRIDLLTPDELKEKVEKKELTILSIIEGPVLNHILIQEIQSALKQQSQSVPLVMMPEYGYSSPNARLKINNQIRFREQFLDKIIYQETIYTGLNPNAGEKGILLSDKLINPEEPSLLSSQLDEKIRTALLCKDTIERYQIKTDLYFQYSHDTFPTIPQTSASERFLKIHRIYSKDSKKNQAILMIGRMPHTKHEALKNTKHALIADGFTKISFYNAETEQEEYLHGEHETEGRHYRVIYTAGMSHASMIAAQALSGDLIGATGDQSFGEALSADKIILYENLSCRNLYLI